MLLLQVDIASQALSNQPTEITMNFWELSLKGGWIMIPIVFLWFVAVYLFIERYWAIKKSSREDINFMNRIKEYIHEQD